MDTYIRSPGQKGSWAIAGSLVYYPEGSPESWAWGVYWASQGSWAVKPPVVNGTLSVYLDLGLLVLLWRAGFRSAPDKTPPTPFPGSGRFIPDEFHPNIPVIQVFETKATGHFLNWELRRKTTQ